MGNAKYSLRIAVLSLVVVAFGWAVAQSGFAADTNSNGRTVALLDLTKKNGEPVSSTLALQQALDIAGIPYVITNKVGEAVKYGLVYTSSYIGGSTLSPREKTAVKNYVAAGGILVSTNVFESQLLPLFGVMSPVKVDTRHAMTWQVGTLDPSLSYFNDANEKTISLGRNTIPNVISTRGYTVTDATPLARFDDGSAAVTKKLYRSGKAYALGFSYTDLIVRNQLNFDYNAQRTYSNGFEPTSDTIILFLRGIYESNVMNAAWKHTSPSGSNAALIITHDVDSQSGMDLMALFADMEYQRGISATYNITTHYTDDVWDNDFYSFNISKMQYLLDRGQKIASHGVGHFPDWNNETVFPAGAPGNTMFNYLPYFDGTATQGGTVYGELEVSRQLLEADLGVTVQSFRSGYLLWNDNQVKVMEALGYGYDSSFSANDVLTNFPYLCKKERSYSSSTSAVYEIPITISDKGISIDNYLGKVANWLDVTKKNADNHAPTVLLIHPNRNYKVTAEEALLDQLPAGIRVMDLDSFGDFWRERDRLRFSTSVSDDILTITIPDSVVFPVDSRVGVIVRNGNALTDIRAQRADGQALQFSRAPFGNGDIIVFGFE